jgi:ApaG protein
MSTSEAVTRGVRVRVVCEYAPERSSPADRRWFFLYTITITNEGDVKEVRGPGVVGKQPVLPPGGSFTYTSGCALATPFGTMEGSYQMAAPGGEPFDVRIAPFTLSEPYTVH